MCVFLRSFVGNIHLFTNSALGQIVNAPDIESKGFVLPLASMTEQTSIAFLNNIPEIFCKTCFQ